MHNEIARRGFLRIAAAGLAAPAGAALAGQAKLAGTRAASKPAKAAIPAPSAEKLTAYELDHQVWVRWYNLPLTTYRAHPTQKYPWFYPLTGPASGVSLTSESSLPWPHHRSVFFGCDKLNGGNYWQGAVSEGQIVSTGLKLGECTPQSAEILDHCEWRKPGEPAIIVDDRRFVIEVPRPEIRWIDARITLTAVQDITITKTNHSLFSVRAAEDITPSGGGHLVNSEGQSGEKDTFGKPAAWCTFYGKRKGLPEDIVEGIALVDHPANPWKNCPWFTRDYGFISPTPFNFIDKPWQLPAGKSIALRYHVVMYAGTPRDAGLAELYKAFAEE